MRRDSRLSGVLHVLLHMAEDDTPKTSEALARAMCTNPVVVRRIMAGLREQGLVSSEKGHGGGWLGEPDILAMGNRTDMPGCLVEQAVNAALGKAFDEAEELLLRRFGEVTLAMLSADFNARFKGQRDKFKLEKAHDD